MWVVDSGAEGASRGRSKDRFPLEQWRQERQGKSAQARRRAPMPRTGHDDNAETHRCMAMAIASGRGSLLDSLVTRQALAIEKSERSTPGCLQI